MSKPTKTEEKEHYCVSYRLTPEERQRAIKCLQHTIGSDYGSHFGVFRLALKKMEHEIEETGTIDTIF